jgi:hypothetical protein
MPALCGIRNRVQTKSDTTGESVLPFGRERMELSAVHVPQQLLKTRLSVKARPAW